MYIHYEKCNKIKLNIKLTPIFSSQVSSKKYKDKTVFISPL